MPDEKGNRIPEDYPEGSLDWLAACILADRRFDAKQNPGAQIPYYFLSIRHPAVTVLMNEYKSRRNIMPGMAMGDMERTKFELEMLSQEALDALAKHYSKRKHFGTAQLRKERDGYIDLTELINECG